MWLSAEVLNRHWHSLLVLVTVIVALVSFISLAFGAADISFIDLLEWVLRRAEPQTELIVSQLRLPRVLLALSVGATLAVCGTVTQGLFRNPLADPSLIGISAGAAAGASLVIVLFSHLTLNLFGLSLITAGAFAGSLLVVAFVYRLSTSAAGTSVSTMLLAGIAFTFLAGSITSLLEFFADNEMLRRISLWRMGGLDAANYLTVMVMLATSLVIFVFLFKHYKSLNVLLLGESEARHLGINVVKLKRIIIVCVAGGVGLSVSLAGTIAFIGLVVPHIVRLLVGPNHRYMIPLTALAGGLLLVLADAFARSLLAPSELPVGLVTAFIGAPVFISMLYQKQKYGIL